MLNLEYRKNGSGDQDSFVLLDKIREQQIKGKSFEECLYIFSRDTIKINFYGLCYKRDEKDKWIPDVEAQEAWNQYMLEEEKKYKAREDLVFVCRSRLLTEEEWQEVARLGDQLVVGRNESYNPDKKADELNKLLAQQFRLRTIVEQEKAFRK